MSARKKQTNPPIDVTVVQPPVVKVTTVEVLEYILPGEQDHLLKTAESVLNDLTSYVRELRTGKLPISLPNMFYVGEIYKLHGVVKATAEALRIAKGKE